jgi:hypothetical protein
MPVTSPEQNKALVLRAFDALFNKRDYPLAERFWSEKRAHAARPARRRGMLTSFSSMRGCSWTLEPA